MKYLLLSVIFFALAISQDKSMFVDYRRGYEIPMPINTSLRGGCYHWPTHPDNTDTNYIKIMYQGKKIIYGEFTDIPFPKTDFRKYAINLAIGRSAADGPDGSTYCKNIDSAKVKRNKYGVAYVELFLRRFDEHNGKTQSEIVGPYFIIDISSEHLAQSLFLDWRVSDKPTKIQVGVSRSIAENIKLLHK